jgi:CspA family cold shock protein
MAEWSMRSDEEYVMPQGTIKNLNDRGFGFILPDGETARDRDLFFHRSDVQGDGFDLLRQGQQVTYEIGTDERRGTPKATRVQALP